MIIKIDNVTKAFKKENILENINLSLESGNIYGFIGRNGTGKTILFKMMCGFYKPTEGTITYNNIDYIKDNTFPKNTRVLIENPSFIDELTGFENLKFLAQFEHKIDDKDIEKFLKLVNLYEEKDKKYSKYSVGMKQKLALAQTFMEYPDVILLDEPFNGLEEETILKIRDYIKELKKQEKIIVIATHMKEDIDSLVDIVYRFENKTITKLK